jgi:hypothetical protein
MASKRTPVIYALMAVLAPALNEQHRYESDPTTDEQTVTLIP